MSDSRIMEQLNSVIANHPIDEVLVALPMDKYGSLVETIVHECEEQGIIVRVRTGDIRRLLSGRPTRRPCRW